MKKIALLFVATVLISCSTQKKTTDRSPDPDTQQEDVLIDEPVPQELVLDVSGNLTGVQSRWAFNQAPFNTWFDGRYDSYIPDPATVDLLKKELEGVTIRAYMGSWCGDSKREVPKFYKLMDAVGLDQSDLTMIAVDRSKRQPVELVDGYNVVRVPTFIFYRNGTEIGRYVERPRESLEQDILKIASGQPYKHAYEQ